MTAKSEDAETIPLPPQYQVSITLPVIAESPEKAAKIAYGAIIANEISIDIQVKSPDGAVNTVLLSQEEKADIAKGIL